MFIAFRNVVFLVLCVVFTLYAIDVIDINPKLIPLLLIVSIYLLTCKNWNIFSKENRERFSEKGTIIIPGNLKVKGNIEVEGNTTIDGNLQTNGDTHIIGATTIDGITETKSTLNCYGISNFKNQKHNDAWTTINWSDGDVYLRGNVKIDGGGGSPKDIHCSGKINAQELDVRGSTTLNSLYTHTVDLDSIKGHAWGENRFRVMAVPMFEGGEGVNFSGHDGDFMHFNTLGGDKNLTGVFYRRNGGIRSKIIGNNSEVQVLQP